MYWWNCSTVVLHYTLNKCLSRDVLLLQATFRPVERELQRKWITLVPLDKMTGLIDVEQREVTKSCFGANPRTRCSSFRWLAGVHWKIICMNCRSSPKRGCELDTGGSRMNWFENLFDWLKWSQAIWLELVTALASTLELCIATSSDASE